jgi:hypothetical protein
MPVIHHILPPPGRRQDQQLGRQQRAHTTHMTMLLQSRQTRTPTRSGLLGSVRGASRISALAGSATTRREHFCALIGCAGDGAPGAPKPLSAARCGDAQTTRPHRRQWCLRTAKLKGVLQCSDARL